MSYPFLSGVRFDPIVEHNAQGEVTYIRTLRHSNFHAHLRRGEMMRAVAKHIMRGVKYLLVMPNTGPIRTIEQAIEYYQELMNIALAENLYNLELIMTLYHTVDITPAVIEEIARSGTVRAMKHYPPEPGLTTGSGHGIPLSESDETLSAMEDCGVPLLGHFEAAVDKNGQKLSPQERERYYIREYLPRVREKHPRLRICVEHATTVEAVEFVKADTSGLTVLTATPQGMLFVEGDFERLSWRNHLKCAPILKTPDDRDCLLDFVTSGDFRAIAGDDTAPHPATQKAKSFDECPNGCFSPHSFSLYAFAFLKEKRLDHRFVNFTALNGPLWWKLPLPEAHELVTIRRELVHDIPDPVPVPEMNDFVIPLGWTTEPDKLKIELAMTDR